MELNTKIISRAHYVEIRKSPLGVKCMHFGFLETVFELVVRCELDNFKLFQNELSKRQLTWWAYSKDLTGHRMVAPLVYNTRGQGSYLSVKERSKSVI